MKKQSFYPLKRFLSLLILDKDIVEENRLQQPEQAIHPIFLQVEEPKNALISIQPEELGGIEDIDTRIFWDEESIAPIFEEEEFLIPTVTQKKEHIQKESSTAPEEDFYDYAMTDIPISALSEQSLPTTEESTRKNEKFVSLRDVLVERGNFWQDKSKKGNW